MILFSIFINVPLNVKFPAQISQQKPTKQKSRYLANSKIFCSLLFAKYFPCIWRKAKECQYMNFQYIGVVILKLKLPKYHYITEQWKILFQLIVKKLWSSCKLTGKMPANNDNMFTCDFPHDIGTTFWDSSFPSSLIFRYIWCIWK